MPKGEETARLCGRQQKGRAAIDEGKDLLAACTTCSLCVPRFVSEDKLYCNS